MSAPERKETKQINTTKCNAKNPVMAARLTQPLATTSSKKRKAEATNLKKNPEPLKTIKLNQPRDNKTGQAKLASIIRALSSTSDSNERAMIIAIALQKKEITVDQLIASYAKKELHISGKELNNVGVIFHNGENDIAINPEIAFKIYKFAADALKDPCAAGNCAQLYFAWKDKEEKNIEMAKQYCEQALEGETLLFQSLYAEILCEIGEHKASIEQLDEIWSKLTEEEKKDTKHSEKDSSIRMKCFLPQLKTIFANVIEPEAAVQEAGEIDNRVDANDGKEANEVKTQPEEEKKSVIEGLSGWHKISELLDGFGFKENRYREDKDEKKLQAKLGLIKCEIVATEASLVFTREKLKYLKLTTASKEVVQQWDDQEKKDEKKQAKLEEQLNKLPKTIEKYKDTNEHKLRRQYQTEYRFFDPSRTKQKATRNLAVELEKRRLSNESGETLELKNTPARRIITAERATIQASLDLLNPCANPDKHGYISGLGWVRARKNIEISQFTGEQYEQYYSHYEKIKLGESKFSYSQRVNPNENHLGDYKMDKLKRYSNIIDEINNITGTTYTKTEVAKEKKLAERMLEFSKKGTPITLEILHEISGDTRLNKNNVDNINRIMYHCFVKECSRWMLPNDKQHELPFATAQARALKLIIAGHLSMDEVFSPSATYGVFTSTDIGKYTYTTREIIKRINNLYDRFILEQDAKRIHFFKEHPDLQKIQIVPTRRELRRELQEVYGGDSDTDGEEGYDSETEAKDIEQNFNELDIKATNG